jgi:hypothetical protein
MAIDRNDFLKNTWRLQPELDVPDLQPPLVLLSVFDSDPRSKYREILQSASKKASTPIPDAAAGIDPQLIRHAQLTAQWDSLFHEVPGDNISFLYHNPPPRGSAKSKRAKGRKVTVRVTTMLGSNSPPGTKWVVTRATLYHRKSVCWCLPVRVTMGKTSKIRLTPKNRMDLDAG